MSLLSSRVNLVLIFAVKMADLHEKMIKLRKTKGAKGGSKRTRVQQLKTAGRNVGSDGSPPSSEASPMSPSGPAKKQNIQDSPGGQPADKEPDSPETFFLLPCTLYRGFFTGKNVLLLHKEEAKHMSGNDKETWDNEIIRDAEGMMRILVDALALNNAKSYPHKDFDRMKSKYVVLRLHLDKVDSKFEHYTHKYEVKAW